MAHDSHDSQDNHEPDMDQSAEEFVEFLKDSKAKSALKDFIFESFKKYEAERVERFKARAEHEHKVDAQSVNGFHQAGNITPILADAFNMSKTEHGFSRALRATQESLNRTVDERVSEVNRLLAGIGGFCSQLKSCFARSTVVFLEKEDPKRPYRERLIFSINLPNYELKTPIGRVDGVKGDSRSAMQATWDNAVNALAQIIESTGLKPKYCKNDRHFGRFVMKQDLMYSAHLPDEYFSFTLDYNTAEKIQEMCGPYNKIVARYDRQLAKFSKLLDQHPEESKDPRYLAKKKKYMKIQQERDYFVGTTPDPNQLDEGLLFLIEVNTLKDYQVVKDRMQSIMTRYILHLSKIAAQEAEIDPNLEHELRKIEERYSARPAAQGSDEGPQLYEVDESALTPIRKKAA